jgi:hypothetical protein
MFRLTRSFFRSGFFGNTAASDRRGRGPARDLWSRRLRCEPLEDRALLSGQVPVFHLLALVYPEVQIPQRDTAPAVSASMNQAAIDAIVEGVQVTLPTMINQLAGDQIQARVHTVIVDRPLDQLYWDGEHYQWADASMISPELDLYTRSGWYDHVFVLHGLVDNPVGPTAWWGGGGLARYGMSMASININPSSGKLTSEHNVPGMIHEWIHGLEVQYFGVRGVPRGSDPNGDALDLHDAGAFGYTDRTESLPGWNQWYGDFLTDDIRNLQSDGADTGLGLGPDAWVHGTYRSDYMYVPGSPLELPDVTNSEPAFLSDVYWASATTSWGAIRRDASVDNNPIRINGVEYDKGVGIHANGEILVNLRGQAERFQADIGVDDDMLITQGTVVFKVYGDGQLLYESGVMTGADDAAHVNVDVNGVQQLLLIVEDGGDGITCDHGVWANAVFLPFQGQFISEMRWESSTCGWATIQLDKTNERNDIQIDGVRYGKGVGTHAYSEIVIPLDGQYSTFKSYVAVDDDVSSNGSVIFQVYTDEQLAYSSGLVTFSDPAKYVEVDVTAIDELRLVVTDAGNSNYADHAVWATAQLLNAHLPGDANDDGIVDYRDASIVGAHWRISEGATWAMGDFNSDGTVDDKDAAILAAHWTMMPPEASEPPTSSPQLGDAPAPAALIGPWPASAGPGTRRRLSSPREVAHDAALAEQYSAPAASMMLQRQRLAWASALARRQPYARENRILGKVPLTVDLLMSDPRT